MQVYKSMFIQTGEIFGFEFRLVIIKISISSSLSQSYLINIAYHELFRMANLKIH